MKYCQHPVGERSYAAVEEEQCPLCLRASLKRLTVAAEVVIADFRRLQAHQDQLLVHGQTLESAAANWDEATLGQSIDFQPLIDALDPSSQAESA